MSDPCLTPAEMKRVEDYDRATAEQIQRDREYAERRIRVNPMMDLLTALENEALEDIKQAHEDMGVLLKAKETFPGDMAQRTDILLWMLRYKIEENHNDIIRWRSYQEPCRV